MYVQVWCCPLWFFFRFSFFSYVSGVDVFLLFPFFSFSFSFLKYIHFSGGDSFGTRERGDGLPEGCVGGCGQPIFMIVTFEPLLLPLSTSTTPTTFSRVFTSSFFTCFQKNQMTENQ
eukprot:TRINITY_DN11758_c2_g1_i1.p1 TRINITY_DN11758_c2_g1~~TRINITY_DN11758_c2_g1_i1.p1  ORF type:complete len:117 (+),score=15.09 TRINITY_DN11758_c2_g1_i1:111-461(+)